MGPGSCPKCGMALEPVNITLDSVDDINPEYKDMLRRFWFSVPPSALLLGMMFFPKGILTLGSVWRRWFGHSHSAKA